MTAVHAIVKLTLWELWRRWFVVLPLVVAGLLLLTVFIPWDAVPPGKDFSTFAMLGPPQFVGIIMAIIVSAGLISQEIERGTIMMLVTKPVTRWQIYLGKAIGAAIYLF